MFVVSTQYVHRDMSHDMTKPTKWVCAQRRLRSAWASATWSCPHEESLATHWTHSEDSDQTGRMPRLIWVFAGRTVLLFVLSWGCSFIEIPFISASPQKGPMTPSKQRPGEEGPPPYNGVPENERARPGMPKSESRTLPRDLQKQALRGPDSRSSPALNSKCNLPWW